MASDRAHYYVLITPAGLETFFLATGVVIDQPFEGELPIPGPVSPEKVSELVAVLMPLAPGSPAHHRSTCPNLL